MKNLLLLLALMTLGAGALVAQDKPDVPYTNYYGLGAGTATGVGFSYRYWPNQLGFQVTGVGQYSPDGRGQGYNLGAAGLWTLQDLSWTKFYTYAGGSERYEDPSWGRTAWTVAAAVGLGFEFIAFDHITFDLMAGYGLTGGSAIGPSTVFSVESGLYYRMQP